MEAGSRVALLAAPLSNSLNSAAVVLEISADVSPHQAIAGSSSPASSPWHQGRGRPVSGGAGGGKGRAAKSPRWSPARPEPSKEPWKDTSGDRLDYEDLRDPTGGGLGQR
eukprot:1438860-Pyramimonas_sp.AAC.1